MISTYHIPAVVLQTRPRAYAKHPGVIKDVAAACRRTLRRSRILPASRNVHISTTTCGSWTSLLLSDGSCRLARSRIMTHFGHPSHIASHYGAVPQSLVWTASGWANASPSHTPGMTVLCQLSQCPLLGKPSTPHTMHTIRYSFLIASPPSMRFVLPHVRAVLHPLKQCHAASAPAPTIPAELQGRRPCGR